MEGWTPLHDSEHTHGQMAAAAIVYTDTALARITYGEPAQESKIADVMMERWPWDEEWFKPHADPVRNLVKAGALIAAEIDRLQRLAAHTESIQLKPGARGLSEG